MGRQICASDTSAYVALADDDRPASVDGGEAAFSIGEMAREFRLSLRTLRFYESRGLVSPRHHGPVRSYQQADRTRLALILKAKKLGFTLAEIRQMLVTQEDSGNSPAFHLSRQMCVEQINMLERQKRNIETALAELRRSYSEAYISTLAQSETLDPASRSGPLVYLARSQSL
jgi:DNA-binding transcriptional MerR regulator